MVSEILEYMKKPPLYAPSGICLWEDEHISKGMLAAHLDTEAQGASRAAAFMDASAEWIASVAPPADYPRLLDLGCGPGLYAQRFDKIGYQVEGIDISARSIVYAREQAKKNGRQIAYRQGSYLDMEDKEAFDVATLIYCDYGALDTSGRLRLAENVYRALAPGGVFILDVFTPAKMAPEESQTWHAYADGGFWSPRPHVVLDQVFLYTREETALRQSLVLTEKEVSCCRVWEKYFTRHSLMAELHYAGFDDAVFYADVAGSPYVEGGHTLCAVLWK
jgi:SAM-dependent methyltransferase